MPDPSTNPIAPAEETDSFEELDRQVEDLLREVQDACETFDEQMSEQTEAAVSDVERQMLDAMATAGASPSAAADAEATRDAESPAEAAAETPDGSGPSDQINESNTDDALGGANEPASEDSTADVAQTPEDLAPPPEENTETPSAPASDDFSKLDAVLGDLLREPENTDAPAPNAAGGDEPTSEQLDPARTDVPAVDADSIDALDEQLAHLTDALLEGDAPEDRPPTTPQASTEPRDAASDGLSADAPEHAPAVDAPRSEPAPPARPVPPSRAPRASSTGSADAWKRRASVAAAWMQDVARDTAHAAAPVLARSLVAASKPLDRAPASVRDTIGYTGVVTAFWALVLWGYVLFVQAPQTQPATTGLVTIASPETGTGAAPTGVDGPGAAKADETPR